jgi:hypothetical protein
MMTGDVGQRHVVFHAGLEHPIAFQGSRPLFGRPCGQRRDVLGWPMHQKLLTIRCWYQDIAENILLSVKRCADANTMTKG